MTARVLAEWWERADESARYQALADWMIEADAMDNARTVIVAMAYQRSKTFAHPYYAVLRQELHAAARAVVNS